MSALMASSRSSSTAGGEGGAGMSFASGSRLETAGYQLHDGPAPGLEAADGGEGAGDRSSGRDKAKKANPLADLIETESAYVSELGKIIKKVAGAWSRSNFPPAELDTMFRNVEAIYRVNRTFLKSLKEIGPNPSSPRALGDLLMRWIDDMEAPYQRYCDNYFTDFDSWPTVQSNGKLPGLLESVSETAQADGSPVVYSDRKRKAGQVWTLDQLFALPQTRLKYYKKLYSRLLKSTQEGRSDHRLLVGANEKLDELLQRSKQRISMSILDDGPVAGEERQSRGSSLGDTTGNTVDSNGQHRASSSTSLSAPDASSRSTPAIREDVKPSFSAVVYPQDGPPPSPIAPQAPASPQSSALSRSATLVSLTDLESRLDTSRTLDIFTMKPKKCQLRINPPGIPFKRDLRKAADVVIYFTPTSTGQEIILRRAHLYLLTDLFLVCERMSPSDRAQRGEDPADMWLLYPPLAGKHLRVEENPSQPNSLTIVVLKKERLVVHTDSRDSKEDWIRQLEACRRFGANMGLKVKTSNEPAGNSMNGSLPSPGLAVEQRTNTPGLSPAISVTPSSRTDPDTAIGDDNDLIRDVTKVLDESTVFSPHDSVSSSLGRGNSFNSFVAPLKEKARPPPQERTLPLPSTSSPALSSAFTRPPDITHRPSPPPLMSGPPSLAPGVVASPAFSGFGSPSNVMAPMQINGRPLAGGMQVRQGLPLPPPPPPAQNMRGSPPSVPNVPPPPHMVNGNYRNGRPPFSRPPPPTGMNGRPHLPPNGFGPNGMPPRPPGNGGRPLPPFHGNLQNDVSRRPSAPDLRRSSDGESRPFRSRSTSSSASGPPKLPSDFLKNTDSRSKEEYSPPPSPTKRSGPQTSTVAAQMRCRLYLKQNHAQWKALGNARLKLYHILPDDVKQLVVENDKKPTPLISNIILPDGVERVGKVGVAVELSDNGNRTGIVYMLHLRSEESAFALFGQLLEGSDRTVMAPERGAL